MVNVWYLFEYVVYAFATEKLRSATKNHSSAIKVFHRISSDLSWTLLLSFWVMPSKAPFVCMPTVLTNKLCVTLFRGKCLSQATK